MLVELGVQLGLQGCLIDHSGDLLVHGLAPGNIPLAQALHQRFEL